MEDKREDKNLNEAEGRVVEAEKKKLALKAVNPMIFLVVIIALCAIASYIVPAGTYDRVLDAASGREIVDPASFHYIARTPVTLFGLLMSVTQGLQNAAYVIFFLMIIGGTFAVLDATGAMNAGMANESAVSQMEATYYQVQGSVLDLRKQINQAENSLALLLAETPRHYERGSLAQQQFPTDFSVGIPVQMLSGRPDVRSAERSLEAAFYGTNKARSAFYPSITLSGSAGWTNSAGVMILNPGKFLASAVGSLTQPLFNRGQVVAQYRIARAQQEEAALGFQQTLLNAGSEVNDALTAYQTSQGKKLLLDKQVASLQTALRSTSLLMEHGNTTYLEVLTARQTLLSAQLSQTANHFTEIQSLINLFQALGGGQN